MAKELIIRQVKVAGGEEMLELTSPYDPDMVNEAHVLAGKWNMVKKKWYFKPSQLAQLLRSCEKVYGYTPEVLTGLDIGIVINTNLEAALEYVSAIKALAPELSEAEREEVLVALLESLTP